MMVYAGYMALTTAQLEERRSFLGSSDIAAVLGVHPWQDQWELLSSKRPDLVKPKERKVMDERRMRFATLMEQPIAAWLSEELDATVIRDPGTRRHSKYPCIGDNVDAEITGKNSKPSLGEWKVSELRDGWGEEMTSDVPPCVYSQCQHHMACWPDRDVVQVVRALPYGGEWWPLRYVVGRDQETIDHMMEAGRSWWDRCVVQGKLPDVDPDNPPFSGAVMRVKREMGAVAQVDFDTYLRPFLEARERRLEYKKMEVAAREVLLAKMGTARIVECEEGRFVYALENAGARVENDKLKREFPEVYAQVAKQGTRQMPRWKATKGFLLTPPVADPNSPAAKAAATKRAKADVTDPNPFAIVEDDEE